MKNWKAAALIAVASSALALPLMAQGTGSQLAASVIQYAPIQTGDYTIDPAHSLIGFSIRHFEINWVEGRFKDFSGTIHYDADDISRSQVEFSAKIDSIDTSVEARDKHLRSADFFDSSKYPEMRFHSSRVERQGNNYLLIGDLTMKGVTRRVSLPFQIAGAVTDPYGNVRFGTQASTKISRRDFNITYANPLPGGGVDVGDEVAIKLQLEALKKKS